MKYNFAFLLFLHSIISIAFPQEKFDKIIKTDQTVIEGKVLKVTEKNIEIDPKGSKPFIMIDRKDVDFILYSDNTVVKFSNSDKDSNKINDSNNSTDIDTNNKFSKSLYNEFEEELADFAIIGTRDVFYKLDSHTSGGFRSEDDSYDYFYYDDGIKKKVNIKSKISFYLEHPFLSSRIDAKEVKFAITFTDPDQSRTIYNNTFLFNDFSVNVDEEGEVQDIGKVRSRDVTQVMGNSFSVLNRTFTPELWYINKQFGVDPNGQTIFWFPYIKVAMLMHVN